MQGFVAANFQATTTNIDWTTTMHFGIIGLSDPNLPLSFFGLPNDCFLRASLDVVNGPVEFVDTRNNKRQGQMLIKPTHTVIAGVAFGQPYQAPFSTR